jgi:hypothetical protein
MAAHFRVFHLHIHPRGLAVVASKTLVALSIKMMVKKIISRRGDYLAQRGGENARTKDEIKNQTTQGMPPIQ